MSVPISIIHSADFHLGAPFSGFKDLAAQLRQEQLSMFSRLISLCARQKPDLLLIAGDLFDQPVPPRSLVGTVLELLDTIPETAVFIAAGNHDPAFIDSPYRTAVWPKHVHCFTDELTSIELSDLPVRIHGAGFTASASTRSLLPSQAQPAGLDRLNLLVLHADLVTRGQSSVFNPVSGDQIEALGIDYAALGHRHERLAPITYGRSMYAYSGCPMGRGFDETGEKCILELQIHADADKWSTNEQTVSGTRFKIDTEFLSLANRRFIEQPIAIDTCLTHDDIVERIKSDLSRIHGTNWQEQIYRIILTGSPADDFSIVPALLQPYMTDLAFYAEFIDRTEQLPDLAVLAQENSLRGAFVRLLADRIQTAEQARLSEQVQVARQALLAGLEAFSGEVHERAYS